MSIATSSPAAQRGAKRGAAKGQGQWALGHREPLNPAEQQKKDDDGLNVRARIETIYAQHGFDSIDPADLRGRFKWFGLYTQRRPGVDGGKTGVLEPAELEDRYFMQRIRIEGGQLTTAQLRVLGQVSARYGRDVADITDRQNLQLHWVRIEDVPALWNEIEAVGLTTAEACGDVPRTMLGCPLAGVAADEVIDATDAILATAARYVGDPSLSNLPRKFKTSISGCASQCTAHEVNDVSFVGVRRDDGAVGFDLWVGGGLSTNPRIADRLGVFVTAEQVPEVWAAVAAAFRDYGYRRLRSRARLKFLLADWGPAKFRQVLEDEYLGYRLPDGPPPAPPHDGRRDHVGVVAQHDGRFAVGAALRAGRTRGSVLSALADLAETAGSTRVRFTAEQKLTVLDVPAERVDALVTGLAALDLEVTPSAFRRGTMACTGIEFCKLAIVDTKSRAHWLTDELERRLPGFPEPVTINVNGCPNSCARIQVADIGLKGMLVTRDGEQVEGFQVHLGGTLGATPGFGRKVRGLKVAADDLADYVEQLLRTFLDQRGPEEPFAAWATRAADADLTPRATVGAAA